jgi:hypothetical protein
MDSELLFIIKKKFYNGRVVRNIYEYINEDTRTMWLKKYRDVINNGKCVATTRFYYLQSGVDSGQNRTRCRGCDGGRRCTTGAERYWKLRRLEFARDLEKIKYITPLTMNILAVIPGQCRNPFIYKFTTKRLFDCCIENKTPGLEPLPRESYSRETLLKTLMSI